MGDSDGPGGNGSDAAPGPRGNESNATSSPRGDGSDAAPSPRGDGSDATSSRRCEGVWDNGECAGTPVCPPRCPRFFTDGGTPLLVRRFDGAPDALVDLYAELDDADRTMGIPPERRGRIRDWLADLLDRGWHLVALDGDRVVGHVGVVPEGTDEPEFLVFVADDYQGRGVGSELVRQVVAYAINDDQEALTLDVARENRRARRLFRSLGFDVVDEEPVDQRMCLHLDHPLADEARRPPAER